jgi:alpha-beta hydrolase superfamily lysophospholipase
MTVCTSWPQPTNSTVAPPPGAEFILGSGDVRLYISIQGPGTCGVVWFVLGPEMPGQAPYPRLTEALHKARFATALVHARGTGFSDGVRGDIDDYALFLCDYRLFREHLAARFPRIFAFGQCVGAALALEVAASPSTPLAGLVLVNPAWKLTYAKGLGPTLHDYVVYAANYLLRPSALTVDMNRCPKNMAAVQAPLLLVQGAHDALVGPASYDTLLDAAQVSDKRKLVAPDGGAMDRAQSRRWFNRS